MHGLDQSGSPEVHEFSGTHVDVPKNLPQRADLEGLVAMYRYRRVLVAPIDDVMATADADDREALTSQEVQHVLSGRTGQLSHGQARRGLNPLHARPGVD